MARSTGAICFKDISMRKEDSGRVPQTNIFWECIQLERCLQREVALTFSKSILRCTRLELVVGEIWDMHGISGPVHSMRMCGHLKSEI